MTVIRAHGRLRWLFSLALLISDVSAQTSAASASLQRAEPVQRELAGGQSHEFLVTLEADEYARVSVVERSINVAVFVFEPDGEQLLVVNDFTNADESVEWIARRSGAYRVRITPAEQSPPLGSYRLTLVELEPATARTAALVAAARAFSQGMSLWGQQTREGALQAANSFLKALSRAQAAQEPVREANILVQLGLVHIDAGDKEKALEFATRALRVAQTASDRRAEAWSHNVIGLAHNSFGDRRTAVEWLDRALPLMRAAADRGGEGAVLGNLGVAYATLGQKRRALEYLQLAAAAYRDIQDRQRIATVANNMGVISGDLGEYQRALGHYQTAVSLRRELADRKGEAITLNNIGTAYSSLAEYQKALDSYTAALQIHRSLDREWSVAIALHNIAWVYGTLGDRGRALDYYQQALAILRKVKDQSSLGNTLNNLGEIHAKNGDHRKALEIYAEALALRRGAGHADGEASTLTNIAVSLAIAGERVKARQHLDQAIGILRTSGDRRRLAVALRRLGAVAREDGNYRHALESLEEALEVSRAIRDGRGEAETLAELARVERDRGDAVAAQQRAGAALAAFESLRLRMASPMLRASFFEAAGEAQELNIELLMRLHRERPRDGFAAEALHAAERGRARSLLELLAESGVDLRAGAESALIAREGELRQLIAGKAEQQVRLLSRKHSEHDAAAAASELDALAAEFDQVQSRIRQSSPRYAALTQPSPLRLNEIQSGVLDDNTVLLQYALGAGRSYLWAVTRTSVDVIELPGRTEIDSVARRVHEALTARNQQTPPESPAARAARIRQADRAFHAAAEAASRMLLAPVASRIGMKRLLIVGDGILNYLPFATLPDPGADATRQVPLMVNHEIVTAPSASVLAVLRREIAGRKPADRLLAVLGDPVFSPDDARVVRQDKAAPKEGLRSAGDLEPSRFARLRFSRVEAETIARLARSETTMKALDFKASREAVLDPIFGRYRIVHFATHSLLDNQRPELSGVVLSLVDRSGRSQNGFLRLYDVYNLKLGADLVVLSGCRTALGGEIKGEGLIGLTRGFFYAGAPRVVASLWEVDDRTAAELMKRFYEGMLVRGERPAAALRSAQLATWKTTGWDQPYYWAAFILQGEWQ